MADIISYENMKSLVTDKLVAKTSTKSYEELSELIFGTRLAPDECRKRLYGINHAIKVIEAEKEDPFVTRILSISDVHYPFSKPIEIFGSYAGKVDILQLNGDILDCLQLSRFPKTYRVSPLEEMIGARKYIMELIELLKPKRVVVNYGNHELRMGAYLAKHLDNEMQELMPETAFDYIFEDGFTHYDRRTGTKTKYQPLKEVFPEIEITYNRTWFSVIDNIIFCHPKAYSSGIMTTSEKAISWFRNEGYNFRTMVMSHTHRLGMYKLGNTTMYEQGACCETNKLSYHNGMLVNSQKEGFLYLVVGANGEIDEGRTRLVSLN